MKIRHFSLVTKNRSIEQYKYFISHLKAFESHFTETNLDKFGYWKFTGNLEQIWKGIWFWFFPQLRAGVVRDVGRHWWRRRWRSSGRSSGRNWGRLITGPGWSRWWWSEAGSRDRWLLRWAGLQQGFASCINSFSTFWGFCLSRNVYTIIESKVSTSLQNLKKWCFVSWWNPRIGFAKQRNYCFPKTENKFLKTRRK